MGSGVLSLGIVTNRPLLSRTGPALDPLGDPSFDLDPDSFPSFDLEPGPTPIPIPIPGELFRLVWSNVPPGRPLLTAVATDDEGASTRSALVEIKVLERPPRPVVSGRSPEPTATEPSPTNDYLDTATFTLHRTGPTNSALTVFYRLGGTALNGVDYSELPYSGEIPAGARAVEVVVKPMDDLLVEGPESVVEETSEHPRRFFRVVPEYGEGDDD